MNSDILTLIQNGMVHFSKGQKLIANYIMNSYDKAAFMTASKLGKTVNVSESTVVRFAVELGYDGYPCHAEGPAGDDPEQADLRPADRGGQRSLRQSGDSLHGAPDATSKRSEPPWRKWTKTAFQGAVDAILGAHRTSISSVFEAAAAIATFLGFYFNLMFDNVHHIHTSSNAEMFEQMIRIGQG